MTWIGSPITQLEYNNDNLLLNEITRIDSVSELFMRTFKDRLRLKLNGTDYFNIHVLFYNENERVKTLKESPIIVIRPFPPIEDLNRQSAYTESIRDGVDFVSNNAPIAHKFQFRVTALSDTFAVHNSCVTGLQNLVFPKINGQRIICTSLTSNDGNPDYKYIYITDVVTTEDFQNNYFQADITFDFTMEIYTDEWTDTMSIETLNLNILATDDQIPDADLDLPVAIPNNLNYNLNYES